MKHKNHKKSKIKEIEETPGDNWTLGHICDLHTFTHTDKETFTYHLTSGLQRE